MLSLATVVAPSLGDDGAGEVAKGEDDNGGEVSVVDEGITKMAPAAVAMRTSD